MNNSLNNFITIERILTTTRFSYFLEEVDFMLKIFLKSNFDFLSFGLIFDST